MAEVSALTLVWKVQRRTNSVTTPLSETNCRRYDIIHDYLT